MEAHISGVFEILIWGYFMHFSCTLFHLLLAVLFVCVFGDFSNVMERHLGPSQSSEVRIVTSCS